MAPMKSRITPSEMGQSGKYSFVTEVSGRAIKWRFFGVSFWETSLYVPLLPSGELRVVSCGGWGYSSGD